MKKLVLLLVVILMGSAVFAVPVGKMGWGAQGLTLTSNAITMPTLQIWFNEGIAGEFGLALANNSGANVSNITAMAGLKIPISKQIGQVQPLWGASLAITSNPAMINNTSAVVIALQVGAEYYVADNFSIEGNIIPLAISSSDVTGTSVTIISMLNSAAGLPAANIGAHIYL